MAKPKKKTSEKPAKQVTEVKEVINPKSEMTQSDAEKLAKSYVKGDQFETIIKDGEEVQMSKYDVIYVTSDKNVFFKWNEGSARNHARNKGLKLFKVEM